MKSHNWDEADADFEMLWDLPSATDVQRELCRRVLRPCPNEREITRAQIVWEMRRGEVGRFTSAKGST